MGMTISPKLRARPNQQGASEPYLMAVNKIIPQAHLRVSVNHLRYLGLC